MNVFETMVINNSNIPLMGAASFRGAINVHRGIYIK